MESLFIKGALFLVLLVLTSAKTFYVTPTTNSPCPEDGETCLTLCQYANQPSNYFVSNITLILLPGNHSLDVELFIGNIRFLSVESNTTSNSDTTITCHQLAKFTFESINVVSMRGLTLFGCVNNEVIRVEQFTMEDCSFQGQGRDGTGLELNQVSTANITRSSFSSNTGREMIVRERGGGGCFFKDCSHGVTISDCTFSNNTVASIGGGIYTSFCQVRITNTVFHNNTAMGNNGAGGAIYAYTSYVTIIKSTFINNTATGYRGAGGAVFANSSAIIISNSTLNTNTVTGHKGSGGAVYSRVGLLILINSTLSNNTVIGYKGSGGAIHAYSSKNIRIYNCTLNNNTVVGEKGFGGALSVSETLLRNNVNIVNSVIDTNTVKGHGGKGGAFYTSFSMFAIENSTINNNTVVGASGSGGAIYATDVPRYLQYASTLHNSKFNRNRITGLGSAFYFFTVTLNTSGFLEIQNNTANTSVLHAVDSTLHLKGNTTVSNNYGSLLFYSSSVEFWGYTNIVNNLCTSNSSQEQGAVTGFQSDITFKDVVNLKYNRAIRGGAIAVTQCKLHMTYGTITISDNTAEVSGGGIYAYMSELNFKENININRNSAIEKGGGIHAISSTTRLTDASRTYIVSNNASRGGGMCLESGSKIYILKKNPKCKNLFCVFQVTYSSQIVYNPSPFNTLNLYNNTAEYGGAMYIDDNTYSATCNANPSSNMMITSSECFIQSLSLYSMKKSFQNVEEVLTLDIYFTNNSASVAGDVIYGGLLDRCGVSPQAEINSVNSTQTSTSATSYIVDITNLKRNNFNSTKVISSDAVRVCFCKDNQPDCSYNPQTKEVRKGQTFSLSLVAVDHINNTIASSTIHASVSLEAKLGEGQSIQQTSGDGTCTDLTYSILSPNKSEKLYLYADGPCMNAGISTANVTVNIDPCPIGFIDKELRCECDPKLHDDYISSCSIDSATVQRKDNAWFAYVNTTNHKGYMLHKHCPFDYCHSPSENISVQLNIDDGSNKLCAFNRFGKLCGSCEDGLSLSLGTSRCRICSNNWLTLLIGFALAGIALVAFLLQLNFTVAVGTFSGLIFYANIFVANRAIFFPNDDSKLFTVFIAWLNLDLGVETCFYDGMDAYAKTWLQLAFPLYVISLVAAIIIISDHSTRFAMLFIGKNPIATLATLILLSYTKLFRTIIASMSFTTLNYSDGSRELVWLEDANIPYLSGKHIPLFITALVIIAVGTTYTLILFSWQWLVYCPNRGPLRWIISNTKVIAFMDAYHNPYNKDHRYWIGLLLLVRVLLYLVSALNVLGDPRINLLSITLSIIVLLLFQLFMEYKHKTPVHKTWLTFIFENISLFNLIALSSVTYFMTEEKASQKVVAYVSTAIAFTTFLAILVYHTYYFILRRRFLRITTKLNVFHKPQNEILHETTPPSFIDEESVSETEIDALPEHLDTNTEDKQFITTDISIDIESAVEFSGLDAHNNTSGCSHDYDNDPQILTDSIFRCILDENEFINLPSQTDRDNDGDDFCLIQHSETMQCSHVPGLPANKEIPIEIELPNLTSSHQLATTVGLLQSTEIIDSETV